MSAIFGLGSGAAALLRAWMREPVSPARFLPVMELAAAAAGIALGLGPLRTAGDTGNFYTGTLLFLAAGLVSSSTRPRGDRPRAGGAARPD